VATFVNSQHESRDCGHEGFDLGIGKKIMKSKLKKICRLSCVSLLIAGSAFLIQGCATPQVLSPAVPAQPASTNTVTGVITPPVPAVAASVTNLPNATVTKIVAEGDAVAPLIPSPYGTAVTALLGLATLIAGYFAQKKNGQLNTANAVSTAIIQGVESAGTAAAAVKTAVANVSKANGVSDAVEAAVNKVTGSA
jgi:PBP1b-binding outer membrane lipoprotein LpoB